MSEPRDTILSGRAEVIDRAKVRGRNVEDILRESRNPRVVQDQLLRTMNDSMPTIGRTRLQTDLPPLGVFDGLNTDFTLSRQVLGMNISVSWCVQGTGTLTELERSSNATPPPGSFFYDGNVLIRLGQAPAGADNVQATYLTRS